MVSTGIPSSVEFSHKIGINDDPNGLYIHDCGIVYLPGKPYFICVMTKNVRGNVAEDVMYRISKTVFDYKNH